MADRKNARKRRYVHVPYATMKCPVAGCDSKNGKPQEGSVPGIKRHVILVHGKTAFKNATFPAIRKGSTRQAPDLTAKKVDELRKMASKRGIDSTGLRKDDLVAALS